MTVPTHPCPLTAYLERALPGGALQGARGTRLEQRGEMRLAPEGRWMPFTADQSMAADHTEFLWHARVRMAPFVTAVVEDGYQQGRGRLDAKVWGLVPVAHGDGPLIDRGEAQRYLAELAWCPLAILDNPDICHEQRGPRDVRVWIGDRATHVDLHFDEAGDIARASTTTRARGDVVQPWAGRFEAYRDFGGIRAPSRAEVCWEPTDGPFCYWRGEILSLTATDAEGRDLPGHERPPE